MYMMYMYLSVLYTFSCSCITMITRDLITWQVAAYQLRDKYSAYNRCLYICMHMYADLYDTVCPKSVTLHHRVDVQYRDPPLK